MSGNKCKSGKVVRRARTKHFKADCTSVKKQAFDQDYGVGSNEKLIKGETIQSAFRKKRCGSEQAGPKVLLGQFKGNLVPKLFLGQNRYGLVR